MSVKIGDQAANAIFGITSGLSFGYIQNLQDKATGQLVKVMDEDGEVALIAKHGFERNVTGDFIYYGAGIGEDEVTSDTQVTLPLIDKKVIMTEVTKNWSNQNFHSVSFSGFIWDAINDAIS